MAAKQSAIDSAAAVWGVPASTVVAADITQKLPWCQQHSIWLTSNQRRDKMVVAVDANDNATPFGQPRGTPPNVERTARLLSLNDILQVEQVKLPKGMRVTELCDTIHFCLASPGGWVATAAFWDEQNVKPPPGHQGPPPWNPMQMWITKRPKDGAALFKRHCVDPTLNESGDSWELSFFYFNLFGGIESWKATGDASSIKAASDAEAVPNATFVVPFA